MAIIKAGFTQGFRGRSKAASFGRRAHYLAAEHDRAGVVLLDREDDGVTPAAAMDRMGGSEAEYHEVIVSPSQLECEAIRQYGAKARGDDAITETARRVSGTYAREREYVTAIHWSEDGRFHFHITVQGPEGPDTFGARGQFQKGWDAQWIHPPQHHIVTNWDLHGKAKELQAQAVALARQQRTLAKDRSGAIKAAPAELRPELMHRCREQETSLAALRLETESQAIEARYGCRGLSVSILKEVEIEKAQIRYQRAIHDLDRAEERLQANRTSQACNRESIGTARAFGNMFRAASDEERNLIRSEHRAAQVVLLGRLHQAEAEQLDARHEAAGSTGNSAHKADLAHLEEVCSWRIQQAEARFAQEELRAQLTEARKGRDSSFRKAATEEEQGRIQNEYEARRLDLWEATTAAKVRVTDLEYRIRGNADSEAHIRAIARVSEQEGKGLAKAIETERMRDAVVNLRMDLQGLGEARREVFRSQDGPERETALAQINKSETALAHKVLAYELTILRKEYEGKASRAQWQQDRAAILRKAREGLHQATLPDEERHAGNEAREGAQDKDHTKDLEARLVREHEEEEGRADALRRAHEEDANRLTARSDFVDMARLGALSSAGEVSCEYAERSAEQSRETSVLGEAAPAPEGMEYWEPPGAWPGELRAAYLARAERLQARCQGVQERQGLDPGIQEKREQLERLLDQARAELRVLGADRAAIVQAFREQAEPIRDGIKTLQRERLDTHFRPRQEGSGIGSEDHARALRELASRASLQSAREDLNLERARVHAQRSEDLESLDRQARRDCLGKEAVATFREGIHARAEEQERVLAHRFRAEEQRHYAATQAGEGREQQEALADERLAAVLERVTLERELRAVQAALRELRGERSEALAQDGADRAALVRDYEARMQPSWVELARLEAARLDTYFKGQAEDHALGSGAHGQALQDLEARQGLALEQETLSLERELLRNERQNATVHAEDRAVREAIHQRYDARELELAGREAELGRRQADLAHSPGSEEHANATVKADARVQAMGERQAIDRHLRQVDDRSQELREQLLAGLEQPGASRQSLLAEHHSALRSIRQETARLHAERLDARFRAEGRENTPDHQAARLELAERLEHRAALEGHGFQRAVLFAERREALAGLRASQDLSEERRELLRKVPRIGGVLDLAAKPSMENRIASREAIHNAHGAKERGLVTQAFELEKAQLDRTLQPGTKEHDRAVELASRRLGAVGERQAVDKELRSIRDQISKVRLEARDSERRPFSNKEEIRAETQAKVDQLRGRADELEHRRLAIQTSLREPVRLESPEGRAHQRYAEASQAHLTKDQELRREIDDVRQSIGHARTDFQQRYARDFLNRPAIQQEYKAQELQKVDRIHSLETARIDAVHGAAGTAGGQGHRADLAAEATRHTEAVQATEERDLGRKVSAMAAYAHVKTVANLAVSGAAPDRIAKQVETRAISAMTNAALDAALGEYAVVAKAAKQVLTMGR